MRAQIRPFLARILPPFIAINGPEMRFMTTQRSWFLHEARYLFLTDKGPVEIAFRPFHALITGSFISLFCLASLVLVNLPDQLTTKVQMALFSGVTQDRTAQITPALKMMFDRNSGTEQRPAPLPDKLALSATGQAEAIPPSTHIASENNEQIAVSGLLPVQNMFGAIEKLLFDIPARGSSQPEVMSGPDRPAGTIAFSGQPTPPPLSDATEHPEDYVSVLAMPEVAIENTALASVTTQLPASRPAPQPMDPEFISFDGLASAPILDDRVKLHRLFSDFQSQAHQVQTIIDNFNIRLDNRPDEWPLGAEPSKQLIADLFVHRDEWLNVLNMIPLKSPLRYYYVTSPYGYRTNKKTGVKRFHHGVDMAGTWKAELRPTASGEVIFAARDNSFGNVVRIRHAHNIVTVYAHLSSINVKKGDFVTDNDILGKMGNTGRSDGMHLHYELHINGKSVNPELFFKIGHQLTNTGGLPRQIAF